jgi:Family of unknown function (DUF6518)
VTIRASFISLSIVSLTSTRRLAVALACAFLFGLLMAWVKGNDAGLRDAIGNMSAPWLLLPFLVGALGRARTLPGSALAGLAATVTALAGFYLAESVVLDLGPHPWLVDLALTMRAGVFWSERAILSGPVFGALGFWWQRRRSLLAAGVVAALFVLEPFAWWLYGSVYLGSQASYPVPAYPALWLGEIAAGVLGFVLAVRCQRARVLLRQER